MRVFAGFPVKKKTKTPRSNKKPKAGSVEYRGVEYFKVLDKMLNMSPEELAAKRQELISKEVEIEKALEREANLKENQDLTKADAVLLAEAEVFERYSNLDLEYGLTILKAEQSDFNQAIKAYKNLVLLSII